ncbi:MAG: DUF4190 domain-containing protein [Candidatus Dormibacteraeota bacterium]|nr:DUF4190 domain-containing protein [Candidatus Dormibacteraeota bacterium]
MTHQGPPPPPPPSGERRPAPQQPSQAPPEPSNPPGAPQYGSVGAAAPPVSPPAGPQYTPKPPAPAAEPYGASQYGGMPPIPQSSNPWGASSNFGSTTVPAAPAASRRRGLAITSLVLGIVAVVGVMMGVFFNFPLLLYLGILTGIAGLVLGLIARPRDRSGVGLAGVILSAVGLGCGIFIFLAVLAHFLGLA